MRQILIIQMSIGHVSLTVSLVRLVTYLAQFVWPNDTYQSCYFQCYTEFNWPLTWLNHIFAYVHNMQYLSYVVSTHIIIMLNMVDTHMKRKKDFTAGFLQVASKITLLFGLCMGT